MLGSVAGIILLFLPYFIGADMQIAELLPYIYGGTFGTLIASGLLSDQKNRNEQRRLTAERKATITKMAEKYNAVTTDLESSYMSEKSALASRNQCEWYFGPRKNVSKEELRREYEVKYLNNKEAYNRERKAYETQWKTESAKAFSFKRYWKWVIVAGVAAELFACNYSLAAEDEKNNAQRSTAMEVVETKTWNAKSIPMPHLTDGSRYVSNPDGVVSPETEQRLNILLKKMDDSLDIESVVAIVNRVENQDIFRFAQDIFDTYHVGKNDRGLVMVLAYEDHLFRTHTGRSLEADLTDAECSRLQRDYLVPSMKAEMPDSGMLYLTQAIYNLLRGKEMPVMSALVSPQQEGDDAGSVGFYFLILILWGVFALYVARRYGMLAAAVPLMANPFAEVPINVSGGGFHSGGFGGGGGGSFGGGGGGFSGGGGFGGGSSGGGGATSSW